jgi:uncharacterized protein YecE (DUF72 family)
MNLLSNLLASSSLFTASGWERTFYPPGRKKSDYLQYYARRFSTVEIDSTFYGVPREKTVCKWFEQTPDDFVLPARLHNLLRIRHAWWIARRVPHFSGRDAGLRTKARPMLRQFHYFGGKIRMSQYEFMERRRRFLRSLPRGFPFAVEIRDRAWVSPELLGLLRDHNVAFALIDRPYMASPSELSGRHDAVTADFAYVGLLGDRYSSSSSLSLQCRRRICLAASAGAATTHASVAAAGCPVLTFVWLGRGFRLSRCISRHNLDLRTKPHFLSPPSRPLGFDLDPTDVSCRVMKEATPFPLFRVFNQSTLHWIPMNVAQLFDPFLRRVNIKVVIAFLPEVFAVSN